MFELVDILDRPEKSLKLNPFTYKTKDDFSIGSIGLDERNYYNYELLLAAGQSEEFGTDHIAFISNTHFAVYHIWMSKGVDLYI